MSGVDIEALRREPRHRGDCALFTRGECTCDWPVIVAALERGQRLEERLHELRDRIAKELEG